MSTIRGGLEPRHRAALVALGAAFASFAFGCEGTSVLGRGNGGSYCQPETCELLCANGFDTGADGCEICSCAASSCPEPKPVGCVVSGCPGTQICDTSSGCASSSCTCDEQLGIWNCTDDCGGGVCVEPVLCKSPNPAGCVSTGCDTGFVCDQSVGCYPSSCACDEISNVWGCTEDCGGGQCVAESPCGTNPAGCIEQGCPSGYSCDTSIGCFSSVCSCDGSEWACTDDCSGGACVLL